MDKSTKDGKQQLAELLEKRVASKPTSDEPDALTQKELSKLDREKAKIDLQSRLHDLDVQKAEHRSRSSYATKVFNLVICWLVFVAIVTLISGVKYWEAYYAFSDKVIITLLSTTTVTVVGLFATVLRYLFQKKTQQKK